MGQWEVLTRWVEHFFIIPFRWYRLHYRNWKELWQRCNLCGCRDKFNFHVPNEVWEAVVPPKYRNRVLCLACFDDFAARKGIDWLPHLQNLCFVGWVSMDLVDADLLERKV